MFSGDSLAPWPLVQGVYSIFDIVGACHLKLPSTNTYNTSHHRT